MFLILGEQEESQSKNELNYLQLSNNNFLFAGLQTLGVVNRKI